MPRYADNWTDASGEFSGLGKGPRSKGRIRGRVGDADHLWLTRDPYDLNLSQCHAPLESLREVLFTTL